MSGDSEPDGQAGRGPVAGDDPRAARFADLERAVACATSATCDPAALVRLLDDVTQWARQARADGALEWAVRAELLAAGLQRGHDDAPASLRHAEAALWSARELDAARWIVRAQLAVAGAWVAVGAPAHALAAVEDALAHSDALAEADLRFHVLNHLAGVLHSLEQNEAAVRWLERALSLAHEIGRSALVAQAQANLGALHTQLAEGLQAAGPTQTMTAHLIEGERLLREALPVLRSQGQRSSELRALANLGSLLVLAGRHDEAMALFEQVRVLCGVLGETTALNNAAAFEARVHRDRGDLDAAARTLREAVDRAARSGDLRCERELHLAAVEIEKLRGDPAAALGHHERYHALYARIQTREAELQARAVEVRLDNARLQADVRLARERAALLEQLTRSLEARAADLHAETLRDALTGLSNRRALEAGLPALHEQARAQGRPLALALIDADHFKRINDRDSHAIGDAVLSALARLLREQCRAGDLAVRYGGEEFVLVLPGIDEASGLAICERLRAAVAAHDWKSVGSSTGLTVSIGLVDATRFPRPDEALAVADRRLYRAKAQGRNRICGHDAG